MNISIRIRGNDPVICHFRVNGYLWTMNFSGTKWCIRTVVSESSQDIMHPTNIRFRLQSFKYLNRKVVGLINNIDHLWKVIICSDAYVLDAFFYYKDISNAREKETKIYSRNLNSNNNLSLGLKVEVSRVRELNGPTTRRSCYKMLLQQLKLIFVLAYQHWNHRMMN